MRAGFVLLEFLIAFLLISLLFLVGYPYLQDSIAHIRMATLTSRVENAVAFARISAMTRHESVIFCGSSDRYHCDGAWNLGQVVRTSQVLLHNYPQLPVHYHLIWKASFAKDAAVAFTPEGFAGVQGSFYIYPPHTQRISGQRLVLNFSGRLRQERVE